MAAKQDQLNWRKLKSMGSLGALGFLMLFQYQNCAPAAGVNALSSSKANGGGTVTIIDNMNLTSGLTFSNPSVVAPPSNAATVIDGACSVEQERSVLGWSVTNSSGTQMQKGNSVCSGGKFKVEMAPSNQMECGESYTLQASFGASGMVAVASVARDCSDSKPQSPSEKPNESSLASSSN